MQLPIRSNNDLQLFLGGTVTESSLIINSTIMLLAAIDSRLSLLLLQFLARDDGWPNSGTT